MLQEQHLGMSPQQVNCSGSQAQLLLALCAASSEGQTGKRTIIHSNEHSNLLPSAAAVNRATPVCSVKVNFNNPASVDNTCTSQAVIPTGYRTEAHGMAAVGKSWGVTTDRGPAVLQDTVADPAATPPTPGVAFAAACFHQQFVQHLKLAAAAEGTSTAAGDHQGVSSSTRPQKAAHTVMKEEHQMVDGDDVAITRHRDQQQCDIAAEHATGLATAEQQQAADLNISAAPGAGACDPDTLQAAAQLLMLQADTVAPPTKKYTGSGTHIAVAAGAAAGADLSAAAAGLAFTDAVMPTEQVADVQPPVVIGNSSRKRCRKPPRQQLQQQQEPMLNATAAAAVATGQDQQQQQNGAIATERRSKRARKTSYKAAEAAEAEDALAELLQRPPGCPVMITTKAAPTAAGACSPCAFAAGDLSSESARDTSTEPTILPAAKHKPCARILSQQPPQEPNADSSQQDDDVHQQQSSRLSAAWTADQQRHKQLRHSDSNEHALLNPRPREHPNKRCVRTSLMPIAAAVQQKLQHVVSFFPDVQLPGAAHLQQKQPECPSSPAAAAAVQPAANADQATHIAMASRAAAVSNEQSNCCQEQQLPSAAIPAPGAPSSDSLGTEVQPQPPQPQQQPPGAQGSSIASGRPRRTPRLVSARSSSPAAAAAAKMPRSRRQTPQPEQQLQLGETFSGLPAQTPAAAAEQSSAHKGRGGRPRGVGNKHQMAPRSINRSGKAGFALRSALYTGVYQSRRAHEGWRAQFCFSNKVLNLGTYATEADAARAWNAAALFFRGQETWLNPVQPALPHDYALGCLGNSVPAATAAAAAEVAAKASQ